MDFRNRFSRRFVSLSGPDGRHTVGNQDDIGFRESRIIGVFGDRIYLYRMIVVRKHQAAVLDERDDLGFFPPFGLKESEAKLLVECCS